MKKILFFILILISINGFSQLIQFPNAKGFGWPYVGGDSGVWIPRDTVRPTSQIISRNVLGMKGSTLYYWNGSYYTTLSSNGSGGTLTSLGSGYKIGIDGTNNTRTIAGSSWILLDSTTTSNVVTVNNTGLFGKVGNDTRALANRTFSSANFAFKTDSLGDGTRWVSYAKTFGGRTMRMVSTNGTDSGFISIAGDLTTTQRTIVVQANKTSTSNIASIITRAGSVTDIQLNVHGALLKESVVALDSGVVQIYRRNPSTLSFLSAAYFYDDSTIIWAGVNRESEIYLLPSGSADQWATNRLSWRTFDSTSKVVLTHGLAYIYGDDSTRFQSDGYFRFVSANGDVFLNTIVDTAIISSITNFRLPAIDIKKSGTDVQFYNDERRTGASTGIQFYTETSPSSGTSNGQIGFRIGSLGMDILKIGGGAATELKVVYGGNSAYIDAGNNLSVYSSSGMETGFGANGVENYAKIKTTGTFYTKSGIAAIGGTLNAQFADVGNVGGGEDDLMTYTVPASTLSTNGDRLEFEAQVQFNSSATKTLKAYFGSQLILSTNNSGTSIAFFTIRGTITRTGATTQRCNIQLVSSSATYQSTSEYSTASETLSGTVILKFTGTATSNDDIVQHMMSVKYYPTN